MRLLDGKLTERLGELRVFLDWGERDFVGRKEGGST